MTFTKFFNPTPLYKEYLILELIEKDAGITQRKISEEINAAVSMVNQYLEEYEKKSYIVREYISAKTVKYHITQKGIERKRLLNIAYLNDAQKLYESAKKETHEFLNKIIDKGFKRIIFYGAGEVAKILLQAISDSQEMPIEVISIIDDNPEKQDKKLINIAISSKEALNYLEHDAVLISSYSNHQTILKKLEVINYPKDKILYFFN